MDDRLSEDEEDPLYDILPSQSQQIERRQQAWGQQRYEDQEEVEEDKVEVFETNRRQNIVTLNNFPQRHTPDIDPQVSSSIGQRQNASAQYEYYEASFDEESKDEEVEARPLTHQRNENRSEIGNRGIQLQQNMQNRSLMSRQDRQRVEFLL